jgi:hypothetical protein
MKGYLMIYAVKHRLRKSVEQKDTTHNNVYKKLPK